MTTYYVAKTGSDSNNGLSLSTPFLTITHALSVYAGGDTIYVRAGTYAEHLDTALGVAFKSGSDASHQSTLAAYNPGTGPEQVIIQPGSGSYALRLQKTLQYLQFTDLIFDGTGLTGTLIYCVGTGSGVPTHVTFTRCEMRNLNGTNVHLVLLEDAAGQSNPDYFTFDHCILHDDIDPTNGSLNHALYINSNNNIFRYCTIYNITGIGVQIYKNSGTNGVDANNNEFSHNILHDIGLTSITPGLLIGIGDSNLVFDNLFYHNGKSMNCEWGATNTLIAGNTFYDSGSSADSGIRIGFNTNGGVGATGTIFRDNIMWSTGSAVSILNYGTGTLIDHNTYDKAPSNHGTWTLANNLTSDPLFVSPSTHDFHLQSGSPARDSGVTVSTVTDDLDGVTRPQGSAYDMGAYEFPVPAIAPTITSTDHFLFRVGQFKTFQLTATGDTPITWSVTAGTLPAGITLSSSGVLGGTATYPPAGPCRITDVTIKASNGVNPDATQNISVTVCPNLGRPLPAVLIHN